MVVGLTTFKFKDKKTYENLKPHLSGWCFFRNDGENYFLKAPYNKRIIPLIEEELIIELSQQMSEQ
jgi:hypothetical protein